MMRGIRSFMGWSHVPDVDSFNPSDDNPFAGPKVPAPSKVPVQMPMEEWLCKKLNKLNFTLVEGYPSRTAEAGSLPMDHFLRPRSQSKWYGLYSDQQADPANVSTWNTDHSKLNSSFDRISRKAARHLPHRHLAEYPRILSEDGKRLPGRPLWSAIRPQASTDACLKCKVICRHRSRLSVAKAKGKVPPKLQKLLKNCSSWWISMPALLRLQRRRWNIWLIL